MKAGHVENIVELIEQAEMNTTTAWAIEFIEAIKEKYQEYGAYMELSELQLGKLEEISGIYADY